MGRDRVRVRVRVRARRQRWKRKKLRLRRGQEPGVPVGPAPGSDFAFAGLSVSPRLPAEEPGQPSGLGAGQGTCGGGGGMGAGALGFRGDQVHSEVGVRLRKARRPGAARKGRGGRGSRETRAAEDAARGSLRSGQRPGGRGRPDRLGPFARLLRTLRARLVPSRRTTVGLRTRLVDRPPKQRSGGAKTGPRRGRVPRGPRAEPDANANATPGRARALESARRELLPLLARRPHGPHLSAQEDHSPPSLAAGSFLCPVPPRGTAARLAQHLGVLSTCQMGPCPSGFRAPLDLHIFPGGFVVEQIFGGGGICRQLPTARRAGHWTEPELFLGSLALLPFPRAAGQLSSVLSSAVFAENSWPNGIFSPQFPTGGHSALLILFQDPPENR